MEKFKSRLSSGNACYHSVQNLCLWNYCVRIYRHVIVPAQPQADVHAVHLKYVYISLLGLLHVLAFVKNHLKLIKKYICFYYSAVEWLFAFHNSRRMQQAKTHISGVVTDHHISQLDVIRKDTVPLVYRWETWLIIFREECRVRMFDSRVLREISGAKREFQETKENRIWVASSPNITGVIKCRWGGSGTWNIWRERRKTLRVLVRICEGKRLFEDLGVEGR